ncbi:MAG: hypothetical protein AAF585_23390 [Verrucomicrobiota bacterium]
MARLDELRVVLPPSAAVAGLYHRSDLESGVWSAPVHQQLQAVIRPIEKYAKSYAPTGLNLIRGNQVTGEQTLAQTRVSVQRLTNAIRAEVRNYLTDALLDPNVEETWRTVRERIVSFLSGLQTKGACTTFQVAVGLGASMTESDVAEGRLVAKVSFTPLNSIESIELNLSRTR